MFLKFRVGQFKHFHSFHELWNQTEATTWTSDIIESKNLCFSVYGISVDSSHVEGLLTNSLIFISLNNLLIICKGHCFYRMLCMTNMKIKLRQVSICRVLACRSHVSSDESVCLRSLRLCIWPEFILNIVFFLFFSFIKGRKHCTVILQFYIPLNPLPSKTCHIQIKRGWNDK